MLTHVLAAVCYGVNVAVFVVSTVIDTGFAVTVDKNDCKRLCSGDTMTISTDGLVPFFPPNISQEVSNLLYCQYIP